MWSGDASLWKAEAVPRKQIEGSLGWLTVADRIAPTIADLVAFAEEIRAECDRVLVLGVGASALAARALAPAGGALEGWPRLEVLDTTEPSAVEAAAARGDPSRTLFVVSSRSGTALDPTILFDYFFDFARRELGDVAGGRFIVVTDPGSALATDAEKRRVRRLFPGDPGTPSPYAALSNYGLVPAALAGVDVAELNARASRMAEACRAAGPENPGLLLGAALGAEALSGRDKLTLSLGGEVAPLSRWLGQLIAGSTGKEGRGIVPVEGEELGAPTAYGSDRFFVRYDLQEAEAGTESQRLATLVEHGHPMASFILKDALDLGAEMFRWEFAAAVAGRLLGVNPFDQGGAREAADRANALLAGGKTAAPAALAPDEKSLRGMLASVRPGDYLAVLAYLAESAEADAALAAIRRTIRDTRKVATMLDYGPRIQQSAGLLHREGPPTGVFLHLSAAPAASVPVPGRPWGFAEVFAAQAAADAETLESRGLRVTRIGLGADAGRGLRELSTCLGRAVAA